MPKFAIITDGVVSNIIQATEEMAEKLGAVPVTNSVNPGYLYDGSNFTPPAPKPITLADKKAARLDKLSSGKVTTAAGNVFDCNEKSILRMLVAISALNGSTTAKATWVMADETIKEVNAAELKEAVKLAYALIQDVWLAPYLAT
jgi:hypothetical protein